MRFSSMNMNGSDFRNQDLRGASFSSCNLNHSDFTGAQLQGARFSSCNLNGATFPSTVLAEAQFSSCNMHGVRYVQARPSPRPVKPEPVEKPSTQGQGAARPSWFKR